MKRDPRKLAMGASLGISGLMLVGKLTAYFITGSTAMLADAAESVVHLVATGFAAFSLWYAGRPADAQHPYGHGRIVYISTGFEGALVLFASIGVIYSGFDALFREHVLTKLGLGLAIAGGLAVINLALGVLLITVGKRNNAVVLISNGHHVLTDVYTTAAAIIGVGLVALTGLTWLDPAAAIILGVWIMISGMSLVRTSLAGLMDKVEPETAGTIEDQLRRAVEEELIVGFHQVRCRRVNDEIWMDAHVLVPREISIAEAHHRVTQVEQDVRDLFPRQRVRITSHIEPDDHESVHPGGDEVQ